jgi:hypothetical protein
LPQNAAGPALNPADDLGHRQGRAGRNEQMHVVGHYLHRMDRHAVLFGGLDDQFLKPVVNRRSQHFAPILRTPYEVVVRAGHRSALNPYRGSAFMCRIARTPGIYRQERRATRDPLSLRCLKATVSRGDRYERHVITDEYRSDSFILRS